MKDDMISGLKLLVMIDLFIDVIVSFFLQEIHF